MQYHLLKHSVWCIRRVEATWIFISIVIWFPTPRREPGLIYLDECIWMNARRHRRASSALLSNSGLINAFCPSLRRPPWCSIHLDAPFLISLRKVSLCRAPRRGCYCDGWFCWNCGALTNASFIYHRAIRTGTLIMYYVNTSSEHCHPHDGFINRWGRREKEREERVGGREILCLVRRTS